GPQDGVLRPLGPAAQGADQRGPAAPRQVSPLDDDPRARRDAQSRDGGDGHRAPARQRARRRVLRRRVPRAWPVRPPAGVAAVLAAALVLAGFGAAGVRAQETAPAPPASRPALTWPALGGSLRGAFWSDSRDFDGREN